MLSSMSPAFRSLWSCLCVFYQHHPFQHVACGCCTYNIFIVFLPWHPFIVIIFVITFHQSPLSAHLSWSSPPSQLSDMMSRLFFMCETSSLTACNEWVQIVPSKKTSYRKNYFMILLFLFSLYFWTNALFHIASTFDPLGPFSRTAFIFSLN